MHYHRRTNNLKFTGTFFFDNTSVLCFKFVYIRLAVYCVYCWNYALSVSKFVSALRTILMEKENLLTKTRNELKELNEYKVDILLMKYFMWLLCAHWTNDVRRIIDVWKIYMYFGNKSGPLQMFRIYLEKLLVLVRILKNVRIVL